MEERKKKKLKMKLKLKFLKCWLTFHWGACLTCRFPRVRWLPPLLRFENFLSLSFRNFQQTHRSIYIDLERRRRIVQLALFEEIAPPKLLVLQKVSQISSQRFNLKSDVRSSISPSKRTVTSGRISSQRDHRISERVEAEGSQLFTRSWKTRGRTTERKRSEARRGWWRGKWFRTFRTAGNWIGRRPWIRYGEL